VLKTVGLLAARLRAQDGWIVCQAREGQATSGHKKGGSGVILPLSHIWVSIFRLRMLAGELETSSDL
jgi:hypothetical protein